MSFSLARSARFEDRRESSRSVLDNHHRPRRRLADAIDEAFRIALTRGDFATAEELVAVLRGLEERAQVHSRMERRRGSTVLERAMRDLHAKKAARYRRL